MTLDITNEELKEMYQYINVLLGAETVDVDITEEEVRVLACQALKDYVYEINQWQVRNQLANVLGFKSSTDFTNKFITENFTLAQQVSDWWASMARVGGKTPWKKDYIQLESGRQVYDLSVDSSVPYIPGERYIHRIMWYARPEFFGNNIPPIDLTDNSLFTFTPAGLAYNGYSMAYLGNVFDVVMLAQALETRNKILRSEFFYNISGDIIELTPIPGKTLDIPNNAKIFYYYYDKKDWLGLTSQEQNQLGELIGNPTQIKLNVIPYSKLNSIGKNWITNYTLALAKYMFGSKLRMVRKIAAPDSDYGIEFDYNSLLEESKTEREELKTFLRGELDKVDIVKMFENKASIAENAAKVNKYSPRMWFTGTWLLLFSFSYL
jgi:hypothetical protein